MSFPMIIRRRDFLGIAASLLASSKALSIPIANAETKGLTLKRWMAKAWESTAPP